MTDPQRLEQLVAKTLAQWGRIDAVMNSFGNPPRPDLMMTRNWLRVRR